VAPEPRPSAPEASAAVASQPVEPPRVTLQVIVYSDVPSQRMVFIDGNRYAEGDSLDAETVLERINADGVVFKRRGVRFVIAGRRE
jgi:type II secretory pathway component PulC